RAAPRRTGRSAGTGRCPPGELGSSSLLLAGCPHHLPHDPFGVGQELAPVLRDGERLARRADALALQFRVGIAPRKLLEKQRTGGGAHRDEGQILLAAAEHAVRDVHHPSWSSKSVRYVCIAASISF